MTMYVSNISTTTGKKRNFNHPPLEVGVIRIEQAVDTVLLLNVRRFICGNALGVDTWTAQIILDKKYRNPDIYLEIALPFLSNNRNSFSCLNIQKQANWTHVAATEKCRKTAFFQRDKYMVDNSDISFDIFELHNPDNPIFSVLGVKLCCRDDKDCFWVSGYDNYELFLRFNPNLMEYIREESSIKMSDAQYFLHDSAEQLRFAYNVELSYQPGDILYIDARPFGKPLYAVYCAETDVDGGKEYLEWTLQDYGYYKRTYPCLYISEDYNGLDIGNLADWGFPNYIVFPHAPLDRIKVVDTCDDPLLSKASAILKTNPEIFRQWVEIPTTYGLQEDIWIRTVDC